MRKKKGKGRERKNGQVQIQYRIRDFCKKEKEKLCLFIPTILHLSKPKNFPRILIDYLVSRAFVPLFFVQQQNND